MPTNPMGILYEQNYNAQAENVREGFIPENLPTVQHVQINFGLKHRSLTYQAADASGEKKRERVIMSAYFIEFSNLIYTNRGLSALSTLKIF